MALGKVVSCRATRPLAGVAFWCSLMIGPLSPVGAQPAVPSASPPESPSEAAVPEAGDAAGADTAAIAPQSWQAFTSEVGQFKVSMPGEPAAYTFGSAADLGSSPGELPSGETPSAETASTEALTEASSEASSVSPLPDSLLYMQMQLVDPSQLEIYAAAFIASENLTRADGDITAALMGCVNGLSNNQPMTPPEKVVLGAYQGVEAAFLTNEGGLQVSRCYIAGDRAYMLTATSEVFSAGSGLSPLTEASSQANPVAERSATMDAFFNSFEIL